MKYCADVLENRVLGRGQCTTKVFLLHPSISRYTHAVIKSYNIEFCIKSEKTNAKLCRRKILTTNFHLKPQINMLHSVFLILTEHHLISAFKEKS